MYRKRRGYLMVVSTADELLALEARERKEN